MAEPSLVTLAAAAFVTALVVGFLKTSVGGGVGLVLTPLLSLVLPGRVVLGLTAVVLNLANPVTLRYYWRQWEPRPIRLMLPAKLVGILAGSWLLAGLSDPALKKTIGAAALLGAALQLAALREWVRPGRVAGHWAAGATAGLAAGVASAVAHAGGIVIGPYLVGLGLGNAAVVGTTAALVTTADALKLVTYWRIGFLGWPLVGVSLLALPLLWAGAWFGYRANRWLPGSWFAPILLAIAAAGALKLLLG